MKRPPGQARINPIVVNVIIANVGVLLTLFFGPNSPHEIDAVAYIGAALAAGGLAAIVGTLLIRRRDNERRRSR